MMKFEHVIPNIVKGFEVKKGSLVLLHFWGEDSELPILNSFALEIAKAGAVPIKWQQSRVFLKEYFSQAQEEALVFPKKYFELFRLADAVVDIFMYSPRPHKDFPKDKLPMYKEYMGKLFSSLSAGLETGAEKYLFVQVRVPTMENAEDEGLDFHTYETAMYNALDIDMQQLKTACDSLVSKLEGRNSVIIHTGERRKLCFELQGRSWYKDNGTGDIPCGEVYISPMEESANGEVEIPLVLLEGNRYENVVLGFHNGRLSTCSSNEILEYIKSCPGDSDMFAEFGIGMNPNVKELIGCPLIDEKCGGTVHIAVGMNHLAGGKNESPLHMDFVFTPVKIEMDGDIIWDNHKLHKKVHALPR